MPYATRPRVGLKPMITLAIVGLALLAVGLAQTTSGQDATRKLGVAAPSQGFTEMYFAQPTAIATLGEFPNPSGRHVPVSFVLHNLSHGTRIYSWTIYVGSGDPKVTGRVTLAAGQQVTTQRRLALVCGSSSRRATADRRLRTTRIHVRFVLAKPAESLSFWELCHG
jgi:hypothetical protein